MSQQRAHVVIPTELVNAIDEAVGARKRSQFLAAAAEKELLRLQQIKALERFSGAWSKEAHPELSSSRGSAGFVKKIRRESDRRLRSR